MRTTLDIDDDVLLAVKQLSHERHEPAGRLVSALVRDALTPRRQGRERNGIPLFGVRPGAGVVTLELVNRLRDEAR
jgi:hypothetical protein